MKAVIFAGPTLSLDEAAAVLDADYRPPAAEGDVFRAARARPQVIGIIDGFFDRVPSVWHKEILWALSKGIHVFGAASMGALRAAELAAFGMEGVGEVFAAYRDGTLEDDDAVAVAHEVAGTGFRAASEALVDIRHTLGRAFGAGVVSAGLAGELAGIAGEMFYPRRNYQRILRTAADRGLPGDELLALQRWLPAGRASLKKADALAMLEVIRDRIASGLEPKQVRFTFENSAMWESAWRLAGEAGKSGSSDAVLLGMVLDELRLEGEPYLRTLERATLRCLAIKHSYVQGSAETDALVSDTAWRLWHGLGIRDSGAMESWMRDNNLDEGQVRALIADQTRVDWVTELAGFEANGYILDQLRLSGDYPRLVERALAKQSSLARQESDGASLALEDLVRWYFEDRLGSSIPNDLLAYCRRFGYEDVADLQRALAHEFGFIAGEAGKAGKAGNGAKQVRAGSGR